MVIMSEERAKADGLKPLARIKAVGMGACPSYSDGPQPRASSQKSAEKFRIEA
jgi:acetyl-CoA acetyltransferase